MNAEDMEQARFDLATATPELVLDYLSNRRVVVPDQPRVEVLTGGVSGTVVAVVGDDPHGRDLVVKQALARLAVPGEWIADQRRTITEARALAVWHGLTPQSTAALVDLDADALVLTMTCAPRGWTTWKQQLLAHTGDESGQTAAQALAKRLGGVLAAWHRGTAGSDLLNQFDDHETFRLLRSDPFYRGLAPAHPELADRVHALADGLDAARTCLVHGDYSPKNVLTGPAGVGDPSCWVVDHEVTVSGDAVFDLAFMLCHLTCKAVAGRRPFLLAVAENFLAGYTEGEGLPVDDAALAAHTATIMLARVDGVSRVNYLDQGEQDAVRRATRAHLLRPGAGVRELWAELELSGRTT